MHGVSLRGFYSKRGADYLVIMLMMTKEDIDHGDDDEEEEEEDAPHVSGPYRDS